MQRRANGRQDRVYVPDAPPVSSPSSSMDSTYMQATQSMVVIANEWSEVVASAKPFVPPPENTVADPMQLPLFGKNFEPRNGCRP